MRRVPRVETDTSFATVIKIGGESLFINGGGRILRGDFQLSGSRKWLKNFYLLAIAFTRAYFRNTCIFTRNFTRQYIVNFLDSFEVSVFINKRQFQDDILIGKRIPISP